MIHCLPMLTWLNDVIILWPALHAAAAIATVLLWVANAWLLPVWAQTISREWRKWHDSRGKLGEGKSNLPWCYIIMLLYHRLREVGWQWIIEEEDYSRRAVLKAASGCLSGRQSSIFAAKRNGHCKTTRITPPPLNFCLFLKSGLCSAGGCSDVGELADEPDVSQVAVQPAGYHVAGSGVVFVSLWKPWQFHSLSHCDGPIRMETGGGGGERGGGCRRVALCLRHSGWL